jgi:hypothetical protein
VKVLFVLGYPGYLRYFDRTIEALVERGADVTLSFDRPTMQAEGMRGVDRIRDRLSILPPPPRRAGWDANVVRSVRGATDYARYLHPAFVNADFLRDRRRKALGFTPLFTPLGRLTTLSERSTRLLLSGLLRLEASVPSDPDVQAFLESLDPDVVLVSPLVSEASPQTDIVKSARALGIPTGVCVASWDHLTTKGLLRIVPDRIFVWNETQREEAVSLHRVPPERVVVTGAQPFDRWFGRQPTLGRQEFCAKVGLSPDRPFLLFVGSTASISRPEAEERFVRSWVSCLRSSEDETVRRAGILIRPHPFNPGSWGEADLTQFGDEVAVWPRAGANPVDDGDRADYFDSLYHSDAVVGINTSAMIEAAIVGRPVFTIRSPDFSDTQDGTLHFHYLVHPEGGFVQSATSLDEHALQLSAALEDPAAISARSDRFVGTFVRPLGRDRSATDALVDEIAALAATSPAPAGVPLRFAPVRALLALAAFVLSLADRHGLAKRVERRGLRIAASITGPEQDGRRPVARSRRRAAHVVKRGTKRLGTVIRGSGQKRAAGRHLVGAPPPRTPAARSDR